jgi:hypothetical protein
MGSAKTMKVRPQSNDDSDTNNQTPSNLVPVEVDGFHAFSDVFALDSQWVIFLSVGGHKDAVKAIRAGLLTNHWINVGDHEVFVLPRIKYGTIVRTLPCGITHAVVFIKNDLTSSYVHYVLATDTSTPEADLYFAALTKHSAVPVHATWKTWLHKRAVQKKELEVLTTHGIRGLKISLNDESLAEDISAALKKGKLRKAFDQVTLLPFSKTRART